IESTGPVLLPCVGVLRLRIPTLNHTMGDDTVKGRAGVKALPRQINKFADMVGRFVRIKLEDELTVGGVENGLKRCGIFLREEQQQKGEQDIHRLNSIPSSAQICGPEYDRSPIADHP